MHNGIQNDPKKRCTENFILSSQSRHEVCSQGQIEKVSLGGNKRCNDFYINNRKCLARLDRNLQ